MSEVIECDYCGKRPPVRWLHVEWDGVDLSTFGEDPGPWDFCDLLCLAAWSFNKTEGKTPSSAVSRSAPPHPL